MQMWAPAFSAPNLRAREKQPPEHRMTILFSEHQDWRVRRPVVSYLLRASPLTPRREGPSKRALNAHQGRK